MLLSHCNKSSAQDKKVFAKLLKTTPEKVCHKLQSIFNRPSPTFASVLDTYLLFFKHSHFGKTKEGMLLEIYNHVKKNATTDWEHCLRWLKGVDEVKIAEFIVNLVTVIALHRIRNIHRELADVEEAYPRLLQTKKRTKKQTQRLEKVLHGKMCSCIKKVKTKSFFTKSKYNPYAVCVSSVYNKRGMPGKPNGPRECKQFD